MIMNHMKFEREREFRVLIVAAARILAKWCLSRALSIRVSFGWNVFCCTDECTDKNCTKRYRLPECAIRSAIGSTYAARQTSNGSNLKCLIWRCKVNRCIYES